MNKTCNSLYCFILWLLAVAFYLTACGGAGYETGLDSVAQAGPWMSVLQPVQDEAPQLTIVDIDSGLPQMTLKDANIFRQPITVYSPSGEYLLYVGEEKWRLVHILSQEAWDVASKNMEVEFLLNDEMLITSEQESTPSDGSQPKKVFQLWLTYSTSPAESDWRVITNQGRYIFKSHAQGLPAISNSSANNTPPQAFCPPALISNWDTRMIINKDGTGLVLTTYADIRDSDIHNIQRIPDATLKLLTTQEALQEALALQQIQENPEYADLSESEKAAMIDTIARSGITGLISPDGQYLLILTATSIGTDIRNYSLNLIDIENNKRIVLSSDSDFPPAFLFSPDGSQIIYESFDGSNFTWYLSSSDGSNRIQLSLEDIKALCWH